MTVPVQTTTAASASSFTFPGNVTAGNGVVICVARASSALFTFTPTSGGDTFSLAVEDSDDYTQIYYVKASSGGYQTINVLSGGLPEPKREGKAQYRVIGAAGCVGMAPAVLEHQVGKPLGAGQGQRRGGAIRRTLSLPQFRPSGEGGGLQIREGGN